MIGGASRASKAGKIVIHSSLTSEFIYTRFRNMGDIEIPYLEPFGNHLFNHCIFEEMLFLRVFDSPFRLLNSLFLESTSGVYWQLSSITETITDSNVPLIRYNSFKSNGLTLWIVGSVGGENILSFGNRSFFEFNRCVGPVGISIGAPNRWARNLLFQNNDLINCVDSFVFSPHVEFLTIKYSDLSKIRSLGVGVRNITSFSNNFWNAHSINEISNKITWPNNEDLKILPFREVSLFPQADITQSGGLTTQADAAMLRDFLVGKVDLSPEQLTEADVDGNGEVNLRDLLILESFLNGFLWRLPAKP